MKRFAAAFALIAFSSPTALAAEDGLRNFLAHLDQPWAQFFVIGATVSALPLLWLIVLMVRGLFNQRRFYPPPRR